MGIITSQYPRLNSIKKPPGTHHVLRPQYYLQRSVSHSFPALSSTNAVSHKLHPLGGIPLVGVQPPGHTGLHCRMCSATHSIGPLPRPLGT